jgi:hypothetical protein
MLILGRAGLPQRSSSQVGSARSLWKTLGWLQRLRGLYGLRLGDFFANEDGEGYGGDREG